MNNSIELILGIITYFLIFGGGALIALYIILNNLFSKKGSAKVLSKWLIVLALSILQTGCWSALGSLSTIGGGSRQIYGGFLDILVTLFFVLTICWLIYCPIKYFLNRNKKITPKEKNIENYVTPTSFSGDTREIESFLSIKGYKIKSNKSGWLVKEPLGGEEKINTLEELEQYAMARTNA